MKKWSIRKKSVNDEISANEPGPIKDISIKNIFKMNFLPITFLVYSVVVILVVMLFMSGASDQTGNSNNGAGSGEVIIFSISEMMHDIDFKPGSDYLTINLNSLDEGDTLVVRDVIYDVNYYSNIKATEVSFEYSLSEEETFTSSYWFNGDISDIYKSGDQVKITVTIKHVKFTYTDPNFGNEMSYDLEVYTEGWESEQYYINNMLSQTAGLKPMPQSCIEFS